MFPIFINDGSQELPKDDVFYVICKEGVYLKKRMGVMESMAPVPNISILESVKATARMHIVPIPGPLFAKVMSFFRAVYKEHRSEAIVLIFYNEKTDKYKIFPPYQKVNYGTVDYNKGIQLDSWQMIGTIHSHASMSAFHSGTDDDDEKFFDGLHITIGDNDDDQPSISASIVANGSRFIIDPLDYIENLQITVDIDNTEKVPSRKYYKWVNGKMIEAKTSTIRSYRKMDKRFMSTVTEKQKLFNQKWMGMVEYITPTYHYGQHAAGWAGWGGSYDPNAWKNWRKNRPGQPLIALPPGKDTKIHPQNVGPHKVAGIKFPEHDQEDINPCKDCVFVNHKMDWVMQQLLDEVEQKDNNPDVLPIGMESYKCTECSTEMVIPETQDAICPICKVDHYLVDTTPFSDPDEDEPTYQCTECDVEFTLADNDEPAVCPACKKSDNIALVEPEVETEYTYEEEEETPYECSSCHKKFFLVTNENCPHCGHSILQTEADAIAESDMGQTTIDCQTCKITLQVRDLINEECPFCRTILLPKEESDFLHPETDAIQAAIEADQEVERLPIPDQGIIPINRPKKKGPFAFMKRLGKIRGRKGIR